MDESGRKEYMLQFIDCGMFARVRIYPLDRRPYRAYRLNVPDGGERRLLEGDAEFRRWVYENVSEGHAISKMETAAFATTQT